MQEDLIEDEKVKKLIDLDAECKCLSFNMCANTKTNKRAEFV